MSSKSQQSQVQIQKLTPQQVLQANIMQLNNTLLEQRIIKELEDNPTLEIVEDDENQETHTSGGFYGKVDKFSSINDKEKNTISQWRKL